MIETRFDNTKEWETNTRVYEISDMETSHIINILRMFKMKPIVVLSILLESVEEAHFSFSKRKHKEAIRQITSLSEDELTDLAINSPLGKALCQELTDRGVNVSNILSLCNEERED